MGEERRRFRFTTVVTGVGVALALAGCGASQDAGTTSGGPGRAVAPEAAKDSDAGPGQALGQPGGQVPPGGQAPALQKVETRALIRTGDITVRVEKVEQAASQAVSLADGAGGFVGSDKRSINDTRSEVHLQLRIPADRFESVLGALAALGKEEARSTGTEDVTEAVVDLDARILSQQASVARTRALLAQARNLGEIVSIEAELAKRESELASLDARKRRLADLTSLSTLTAHLLGPDAEAPPPDEQNPGFLAGLEAGWDAFFGAMVVLLTVLGFLLPFALVVGLPVVLLIWLLRRRRRPAAATAVTPTVAVPARATPD